MRALISHWIWTKQAALKAKPRIKSTSPFRLVAALCLCFPTANAAIIKTNPVAETWRVNAIGCNLQPSSPSLPAACEACRAYRGDEGVTSSQTSWKGGSCTFEFSDGSTFGPVSAFSGATCPEGYRYYSNSSAGEYYCYISTTSTRSNPTPGFDQGVPPSDSQSCAGSGSVGDPIYPGTGNAYQHHVDYSSASAFPLEFARYYNAVAEVEPSDIGVNWRHTYSRSIVDNNNPFLDLHSIYAIRPDGKRIVFESQDGVNWTSKMDYSVKLESVLDNQNQLVGWRYIQSNDTVETYDLTGALLSIQDRNGLVTTIQRDSGGLISSVQGPYGRTLTFTRDQAGRIDSVQDPSEKSITYSYDANGDLSMVTYQDGTSRQYLYNEAQFVTTSSPAHLLTGIVDENGHRWVTTTFDDKGRAIEVYDGNGANSYQVIYPTNSSSRTVIDPLGTSRTFQFQTVNGFVRMKGTPTGGDFDARGQCKYQSVTFDANGFVSEGKSFNAYSAKTTFVNDSKGLELQRTEASGTSAARTISTTWESAFRLPKSIVENGKTTDYAYYSNGDLKSISITDQSTSEVRVTQFMYDSPGLVKTVDGPRTDVADITTFSYDSAGNITQIENAEGHITQYQDYDQHGNPGRMIDPNGVVSLLYYDERLRLTRIDRAGRIWEYGYDHVGNLISITGPDQYSILYTYDDAHRLNAIELPDGSRLVYTLNGLGKVEKEEFFAPNGSTPDRVVEQQFNTLGQVALLLGQNGQQTDLQKDGAGNVQSRKVTYESGILTTNFGIDALDRITQVTDPLNGVVRYSYDGLDQLTSVTDSSNLVTQYQKNAFGDTLSVDSPDTGVTTIEVDAAGNRTKVTDAEGRVVEMDYDALGRLTQRRYPGHSDQDVTYYYDGDNLPSGTPYAIGRLTGVASPGSNDQFFYDAYGNLTKVISDRGVATYTVQYQYNALNLVTQITYPSGNTLQYGYDIAGRVNSVDLVNAAQTIPLIDDIQYQPFGDWSGMAFSQGLQINRSFDLDGRITSISTGTGFDRSYDFDLRNQISQIADLLSGGPIEAFGYSEIGQLTAADGPFGAISYSYLGSSGDRATKSVNGTSVSYAYNSNTHQIASLSLPDNATFTHDASGRIDSIQSNPLIGAEQLSYNAQGRLATYAVNNITGEYTYDGFELRIRKIVTESSLDPILGQTITHTEYGYTPNGHLLWEQDMANAHIREYYWVGDQLIGTYALNNSDSPVPQLYLYITDHRGAPYEMIDSSGAVAWEATYSPFGDASVTTENVINNIRFPGQYFDAESSLLYNWHRYYDPNIGRYLSSDPIGLRGGLNTYAYANSNPIMYIDPLGLTSLQYDQSSGTLTVDPQNGQSPYNIQASSGRNGSTDQTARNQGPIPTGGYTGNASNLTNPGLLGDLLRNTQGDWGDWRMPLNPNDGTNTYGRDGFFLHGGSGDGSAGCIDVGGGITGNDQTDRLLNDILNDPDGIIPLTVVP